jgi:hypothetical protein|tara:strand:- start:255 stop:395 length:141 start_codon:yes stop_codon:yes gene_type:complete
MYSEVEEMQPFHEQKSEQKNPKPKRNRRWYKDQKKRERKEREKEAK